MLKNFGPLELVIILVIVLLIFGAGKLPSIGGAIGKSIREFKKEKDGGEAEKTTVVASKVEKDAEKTTVVSSTAGDKKV
jgi:sec-independent protein translocase protein TatA